SVEVNATVPVYPVAAEPSLLATATCTVAGVDAIIVAGNPVSAMVIPLTLPPPEPPPPSPLPLLLFLHPTIASMPAPTRTIAATMDFMGGSRIYRRVR